MSNVRDERLFRTFRDGKVKFYQPGTQKQDWFNLMSVHQNQYDMPLMLKNYADFNTAIHTPTLVTSQKISSPTSLTWSYGAMSMNVLSIQSITRK